MTITAMKQHHLNSNLHYFSIVLLIGAFLSVGFDAFAQEQERPQPPPRETRIPDAERIERQEVPEERLPEFELPEYVITGRATFRLPYVQKQNVTERNVYVAAIPESMQYIDRDIDTTPIDVPTKSFGEFAALPTSQHGQVRLGFGRFNTPALSGWAHLRSGPWMLATQLHYLTTEGYKDFAEGMDLDARFRAGYQFDQSAPLLLQGAQPYLAFGFETVNHHILPDTLLFEPLRDRGFRSAFTEVGFLSGAGAPFDFDLSFGWRGSTLEDESDVFEKQFTNDDEIYARASTLGYLGSTRLTTDLVYKVNKLEREVTENDTEFFNATVRVLFPFMDNRASVELGGSYYSLLPSDSDRESLVKPFAEFRYMPGSAVTFYAAYAPGVNHHSLPSLRTLNPFVNRNVPIRFSDERVTARAGAEYAPTRAVQVNSFVQYRSVDDYPVFLHSTPDGTFVLDYTGRTTVFSLHTDVRYAPSEKDFFTSNVTLRHTNNDEFDMAVPFLSPVEIAAMYTRDFGNGIRGSVGVELFGPRTYSYLEDDGDLSAFLNLHLDVQYQFHNIMGVYMRLDNIFNQAYERYYPYPARPFYIEGGIQLSF
jgi:hypothetical protein